MRRTLVPALALALLPFAAVSPADAGTAAPGVITPTSGAATLTFTLAEAVTGAALEVRSAAGTLVYKSAPADLAAGDQTLPWDGRTTAGAAVADGSYVAALRVADAEAPLDQAPVRVNLVAPRQTAAPRVSATSVFPWTDGYRDAVTITSQSATSETSYASSLQVLNRAGTVVWSSTARNPRWTGRTSKGVIVAPGTYRVRSRFVDGDGLTSYSPARAVTVSNKRLINRKVVETLSPRGFLWNPYTGKCGKIVKPARKGKAWKRSISVSSNHKCTSKGARSITEARFAARLKNVYDYRTFTITAVGAGHTKARKNFAVGYGITAAWDDISRARRLSPKLGTRTVFSASGSSLRRFVDTDGWIVWAIGTAYSGRYDVKSLKVRTTYRALVAPSARGARVAPTSFIQPHG